MESNIDIRNCFLRGLKHLTGKCICNDMNKRNAVLKKDYNVEKVLKNYLQSIKRETSVLSSMYQEIKSYITDERNISCLTHYIMDNVLASNSCSLGVKENSDISIVISPNDDARYFQYLQVHILPNVKANINILQFQPSFNSLFAVKLDFILEANCCVNIKLQNQNPTGNFIATSAFFLQDENSYCSFDYLSIDHKNDNFLEILHNNKRGSKNNDNIMFLNNSSNVTLKSKTYISHPNTEINHKYKVVSEGKSFSEIDAAINLFESSGPNIASQNMQCLELSKNSVFIAKPFLLLSDKNNLCNHAASKSSFDEESLFFLSLRGIDYKTSVEILLLSFLSLDVNNKTIVSDFLSEKEGV